eukprot:Hpha_TRINITY_DN15887_c1_g3::TRINITY_DN15887_c1_g3_i1::g.189695::m.189695
MGFEPSLTGGSMGGHGSPLSAPPGGMQSGGTMLSDPRNTMGSMPPGATVDARQRMQNYATGGTLHPGATAMPQATMQNNPDGDGFSSAQYSLTGLQRDPVMEDEIARLKAELGQLQRQREEEKKGNVLTKGFNHGIHGVSAVTKGVAHGVGGVAKVLHLDDAARKLHLDTAARKAARVLHVPLSTGPPALLFLTVLKARGVAAVDKKKGRSAPFCVIELMDGQKKGLEKERRRQRTRVVEKTVDPDWLERLLTLPLNPGAPVQLRVQVYSAGMITDDYLGGTNLELSTEMILDCVAAPRIFTVALKPRDGQKRDNQLEKDNGGTLGRVTIQVRTGYSASTAPRQAMGISESMEVHVLGATDLKGSKKMESYAAVKPGGSAQTTGESGERRTRSAQGRNPDYDDRFSFRIIDPNQNATLDFTVFDRKGGGDRDQLVGEGRLTLRPEELAKAMNAQLKSGLQLKQPGESSLIPGGLEKVTKILPGKFMKGNGSLFLLLRTAAAPVEVAGTDTDQGRPGGIPVMQQEEEDIDEAERERTEALDRGLPMAQGFAEDQPASPWAAPQWANPENEEEGYEAAAPWAPQAYGPEGDDYPHQAWCTGYCGGICAGIVAADQQPKAESEPPVSESPPPEKEAPEVEPAESLTHRSSSSSGAYSDSEPDPAAESRSSVSTPVERVHILPAPDLSTARGLPIPELPAGRGHRRPGARVPPPLRPRDPASFGKDTRARGMHEGEWRGEGRLQCCSTQFDPEGKLCTHRGGPIPAPHWSCCGGMEESVVCSLSGFVEEVVTSGVLFPSAIPPSGVESIRRMRL